MGRKRRHMERLRAIKGYPFILSHSGTEFVFLTRWNRKRVFCI